MITRRHFLGGACASLALPRSAHGARTSEEELIARAMAGIDPETYLDVHNHVVGMGHGGTGVTVHPHMTAGISHPLNWIRFRAYIKASGITDMENVDAEYMAVLKDRVESMPTRGTSLLMAFDQVYDEAGKPQPQHTVFSVPNDHMFDAVELSARFAPCASVHPYRADAVDALHAVADRGAVAIKWLPNAMHIDPANPLCTASYAAMAERGLTLISHGGEESAVPSPDTQELGNPLRLRAALDAGVKVVVAHSASHGHYSIWTRQTTPSPCLRAFMRMMDDPQYEGRLYGEISAVLLFNRVSHAGPGLMHGRTSPPNGERLGLPHPRHQLAHQPHTPVELGVDPGEDKRGLSRLFERIHCSETSCSSGYCATLASREASRRAFFAPPGIFRPSHREQMS